MYTRSKLGRLAGAVVLMATTTGGFVAFAAPPEAVAGPTAALKAEP
jgi:hypothetical protein